jgi:hemerythrin-like domain-containing protein
MLNELHEDHLNVAKLSQVAREEIDTIRVGGNPDYELLEGVMRYLTGYSDVHHHPAEDALFARLRIRAPERKDALDSLLLEHEKIKVAGQRLLDQLRGILEGTIVRIDAVTQSGHDYFSLLDEHMNQEESLWFPLLGKALTAEDWAEAEKQISSIPDPLFGPTAVSKEFQHLLGLLQDRS